MLIFPPDRQQREKPSSIPGAPDSLPQGRDSDSTLNRSQREHILYLF